MQELLALTGARGFVGRVTCQLALERGFRIRALSRRPPNLDATPDGVTWHQGDLLDPEFDFAAFTAGARAVIHCAGEIQKPQHMAQINGVVPKILARHTSQAGGRFVHLSSVGIYGHKSQGTITEDHPQAPQGPYETTKAEADSWLAQQIGQHHLDAVILRPSNIYGPGMPNRFYDFFIKLLKRRLFFFVGQPGARIHGIHVANVAKALVLCASHPQARGSIFNLSDDMPIEDFVATIATTMGLPVPRLRLPSGLLYGLAATCGNLPGWPLTRSRLAVLTARASYANDRIANQLGYAHPISFAAGIKEVVQHKIQVPPGGEPMVTVATP